MQEGPVVGALVQTRGTEVSRRCCDVAPSLTLEI